MRLPYTKSSEIIRSYFFEMVSTCELARQVGVSKSNVSYWLKGGGITLEKADLALKALGLSVVIEKEDSDAKAKSDRA